MKVGFIHRGGFQFAFLFILFSESFLQHSLTSEHSSGTGQLMAVIKQGVRRNTRPSGQCVVRLPLSSCQTPKKLACAHLFPETDRMDTGNVWHNRSFFQIPRHIQESAWYGYGALCHFESIWFSQHLNLDKSQWAKQPYQCPSLLGSAV